MLAVHALLLASSVHPTSQDRDRNSLWTVLDPPLCEQGSLQAALAGALRALMSYDGEHGKWSHGFSNWRRKEKRDREKEENLPFPNCISIIKENSSPPQTTCVIVDGSNSLFKTKVAKHLLCAKPYASKMKTKQNKAEKQALSSSTQHYSRGVTQAKGQLQCIASSPNAMLYLHLLVKFFPEKELPYQLQFLTSHLLSTHSHQPFVVFISHPPCEAELG